MGGADVDPRVQQNLHAIRALSGNVNFEDLQPVVGFSGKSLGLH